MIARWFWREWRTPSMLIVWLALTLSVACVLALGMLSDRMEKGLNQQSRDFLAGDRVLRAARPVDERWLSQAAADGLTFSRQLTFMTMTFAGDAAPPARVKAADGNYPLYGALLTRPANLRPAAEEVLVAPLLLALLGLKMGDSMEVGDATLRVADEVLREPDSGFNPFQTAPGIIIDTADVEKTGAVQPGGRVTWRYMFAGGPEPLQRFEDWLTPQLKADQRWYSRDESSGALNRSMERSQYFLLLSALLTLIVVGVGGDGGDGPLLPQPRRAGGGAENPGRRPAFVVKAHHRPVDGAAGILGHQRRRYRPGVRGIADKTSGAGVAG